MEEKTVEILRDAPVPKAVIYNVVPAIVGTLMSLVYSLADTFFIGQVHDPLMVAAVSLASPMFLIYLSVGMLFGVGGTSLISRRLGAGDEKVAKNISSFCFWTSVGIGIVLMILVLVFINPVCRLIGASEDTLVYTRQYVSIITIGVPFQIINNLFSNVLRAEGRPRMAMVGTVGGNLINLILDPILILALGLNMKGAAIATLIGNGCGTLFYILFVCSKKSVLSVNPKDYRAGDHIASSVFAIGVPSAISSLLMSVSNMVANNTMESYGDLYVAGLGVALRVNSIVTMIVTGIGTGTQPLIGYSFGAGNKKRYTAVMRFSLILAFCLSIVMSVLCFACAKPLVGAFLSDADARVYGVTFSRIYICSGPIMGMFYVLSNAIQASGAAVPALVLSLCRQGVIYIPLLLILNAVFHAPYAVGAAQPITDCLTFILAIVMFIVVYRVYFRRRLKALEAK